MAKDTEHFKNIYCYFYFFFWKLFGSLTHFDSIIIFRCFLFVVLYVSNINLSAYV